MDNFLYKGLNDFCVISGKWISTIYLMDYLNGECVRVVKKVQYE